MSTTSGPVTLTLGATANIANPTARGGNPAASVQVQNSSTFVLTVIAAGLTYTLQPFIAQTLPLTSGGGAPIEVTPSQNPSGVTADDTATFVWLLDGESPPMQDGPLTAAAILATVNPSAAVVAAGTATFVSGLDAETPVFALPSYTRSLIVLAMISSLAETEETVTTEVLGEVSGSSTTASQIAGVGSPTLNPVGAPMYGVVDSTAVVAWLLTTAVIGATIAYWVIAVPDPQFQGQLTAPLVVQAEENIDAVGNIVVSSTTGAVTLVPPPPPGFLYKVRNFSWNNSNAAAATALEFLGLISGSPLAFLVIPEQTATVSYPYPSWEFNTGEGIEVTSTSATAIRLLCTYRLVPTAAYN